jgi:hypothetical protein
MTSAQLMALPSSLTDDCLLSLNLGLRRGHTARNPSSQDTEDELPTLMVSNIALRLEKQVPGVIVSAYCDMSAGQPRPYVSDSLRLQVFQSSSPSQSTRTTRSGHHVHFPARFNT